MKLLFVHDHKFKKIGNDLYSSGGLADEALERYTSTFGDMNIIARVIAEETALDKYSKIKNKQVNIKNGLTLTNKEFKNEVKNSDVVISRMPSFYGLKAIKYAKKFNKPYLVEMVGCPWDALWNHSIKGKVIAPYMTLKTKIEAKNAAYVLYVTNEFLQKRYPTNGKTVNCSNVALTEFNDDMLENRLKKIQRSEKIVTIGTTAAVDVRYKGQQYIIEAIGKLKKRGITNFRYEIVGGGSQDYLKSIVEKNNVLDEVSFLGSMPHDKVFGWLETIDIYAQPSKQEGLPRALIEAMSRAVPSLGAKTAGIPELLDAKYIFSNTSNNITEICSALVNFSKEDMEIQAKRNYNESKKYDKEIIDTRRKIFFEEFKNHSKTTGVLNN